ncbi:hypothetical protein C8F04DRAFT_1397194 [Mycena alexandri]|uniref:Uncharacterized protein n=1 Tax=Mycena alexandri TaxID=1745969 RepID=A0AAD6WZX9_9AGAR|nr:hypothetical protein C8F04DRAFT_1397194 [Mycena alexandri]
MPGRHPTLYFQCGTLTIKAWDGTLYNVYREPLLLGSEFFSGMLSLLNPAIPSIKLAENAKQWYEKAKLLGLEGSSDDTAVEMPPQFSSWEIEMFLEFMYLQGWSNAAPDVEKACAILKISHFLVAEKGISYARFHLDHNDKLGPVLRLKLGFDYFLADWVTKAFDDLMSVPINEFSAEDEATIGWVAYRALAKAQAKVLDARLNLALRVPDVNHCNWCSNLPRCRGEWERMWTSTDGVLGAIIREELAGAEILDKLATYPHGAMVDECHRRTCEGLQDTPGKVSVLREEEGLIDEAVEDLMRSAGIPFSKKN